MTDYSYDNVTKICKEKLCTEIDSNCTNCDTNNKCTSCSNNYVLISENGK